MGLTGLKSRRQQRLLEDFNLPFLASRGCPYSLAYGPLFSIFKASTVGPSLPPGAISLVLSCESLCFRTRFVISANSQPKRWDAGAWEQEDQVSNPHPQRQGAQSTYWIKDKEAVRSEACGAGRAWEAWGKVIGKRCNKCFSAQA